MRNITRHTGTLHVIDKLPNSRHGNPRYVLSLDGWTCVTKPDSDIAYGISKYAGKRVLGYIGTHYGRATLLDVQLAGEG